MPNSNADRTHPPPPPQPSLSSLPDDIVLRCLVLVPRIYHLNISWVSKHLRSLVHSPELNALRSILLPRSSSLHVCFEEIHGNGIDEEEHSTFHWFTLTSTEEEYGFVLTPTPFPPHPNYGSTTVVSVGSKIFFIGGSREPSTDLWILDTRTGNMTQGPSMSVPRVHLQAAVGVIDGKIYILGGGKFDEEFKVEVFDPESETWELAGAEIVRKIPRSGSSVLEGKVYMVEYGEINVYNPREGGGQRMVHMVSQRLSEDDGSKVKFTGMAYNVCVVEDVLFAFFIRTGLMWFDTKLNVWRKLIGRDGKELVISRVRAMSEYDGRLVVFTYIIPADVLRKSNAVDMKKDVQCMLVSLDRAGDKICGTIDWSGIVATVPVWFNSRHCLAVSE
ncbi:Galactose oxidase/kelch repeat superfamily protein [Raphanus sativus]|uniref:F-box/kelch-repeat protein At2g22050-like n=1 Tax=Raphanus sativus TaxID=3726 RepID=A0A6J0JU14_RAPSA|nr:F-box/kelch-repeat protein At2g22050-like [Raphanus sativus]KAJ4890273.1 Galactose oxidase/kelch repeat superfamily protein [Raphanus sativus]